MRLQAKNMPPNTIFLYRGEWYIKKEDFRVDGQLYNCITEKLHEPDYALLDELYVVSESTLEKNYWVDLQKMLIKLQTIKAYSELDRNENRHIPLTSAQGMDLDDAIFHINRILNPV